MTLREPGLRPAAAWTRTRTRTGPWRPAWKSRRWTTSSVARATDGRRAGNCRPTELRPLVAMETSGRGPGNRIPEVHDPVAMAPSVRSPDSPRPTEPRPMVTMATTGRRPGNRRPVGPHPLVAMATGGRCLAPWWAVGHSASVAKATAGLRRGLVRRAPEPGPVGVWRTCDGPRPADPPALGRGACRRRAATRGASFWREAYGKASGLQRGRRRSRSPSPCRGSGGPLSRP